MSLSTTNAPPRLRDQTRQRHLVRLEAVAAALLAALAIWLVAEWWFGIRLQAPSYDGSGQTSDISALDVVGLALLLSLGAWGFLALLETLTSHARVVWTIVAPVFLVLTLATPLSGTGVTTANRIVLVLMHLAVGSVLIVAFCRTSPSTAELNELGSHW